MWRYVPRGAHPLHFGFILRAGGRWNRAGRYGALYLALGRDGALAERALDLTDPAEQRRFGVTGADLTADGPAAYELCRRTADLARASGHLVLFVPSAPLLGATNVIVYPEVPPAHCQLDVGPDRIPLP